MKHLKTIQYQQEDSIAIISIDRPDAMNSINEGLRSDLLFAFEKASTGQKYQNNCSQW